MDLGITQSQDSLDVCGTTRLGFFILFYCIICAMD
jgi:hypothetical protein